MCQVGFFVNLINADRIVKIISVRLAEKGRIE